MRPLTCSSQQASNDALGLHEGTTAKTEGQLSGTRHGSMKATLIVPQGPLLEFNCLDAENAANYGNHPKPSASVLGEFRGALAEPASPIKKASATGASPPDKLRRNGPWPLK